MTNLKSVRAGQTCTAACLRGDSARSYRNAPHLLALAVSCVLMGYQTETYAVAPVAQNPVKGTLILYEDQYAGLNSNNTLVIDTGASVELNGQRLSAGYSNDSNSLVRNNVLNSSGNVTDSYELQGGLYAGSAISDGAKTASVMSAGNTINITDGTITLDVSDDYGVGGGLAYANSQSNSMPQQTAEASSNKANISGGSLTSSIHGGRAIVITVCNGTAIADDNTLTISGGTVEDSSAVYGGRAKSSVEFLVSGSFTYTPLKADASSNSVVISGGSLTADIYGGHASVVAKYDNDYATANSNSVSITGGTVSGSSIYGGYALSVPTVHNPSNVFSHANADYNLVSITDGNVSVSAVYGGFAWANSRNYSTGSASASNNTIILGTGSYGAVYGGYVSGEVVTEPSKSYLADNGTASYNTVYVYGSTDLSNTELYGGYVDNKVKNRVIEGNELVFGYNGLSWLTADSSIYSVRNFSDIDIDSAVFGKTITIKNFSNDSTDSTTTVIDASYIAFDDLEDVPSSTSFNLLQLQNIESGAIDLLTGDSYFSIGTALEGDGYVSLQDSDGDGKQDTVVFSVTLGGEGGGGSIPGGGAGGGGSWSDILKPASQTHNVSMTSTAATVALTSLVNTSTSAAFNLANSGTSGIQGFSSVGGGAIRAETGSHVTVKSLNFSVGVGNNLKKDFGVISLGGAFEGGYGRFTNHFNAGRNDSYVHKKGHVSYYGVALMTNLAFNNLWHADFTVRGGKVRTSNKDGLYNGGDGKTYDIKLKSNYYGFEVGGGKVIRLTQNDSIDIYGRYYYLHQSGDHFFTESEKYDVKAVNSSRIRIAGRYMHSFNEKTSLYAGAGVEKEFSGKSEVNIRTKLGTLKAEPSKLKGTYGILETGFVISPKDGKGLSFDLGLKGMYGKDFRGLWLCAEGKYTF